MAHSSEINNSISFFFLCSSAFEKASLLILHWLLCIFDPIMCKWILKKEKEQNPTVDLHQNICQQTHRWAQREHQGLSDPSSAALMDTAIYL